LHHYILCLPDKQYINIYTAVIFQRSDTGFYGKRSGIQSETDAGPNLWTLGSNGAKMSPDSRNNSEEGMPRMENVTLTGTGLTVSRVCLGTMTFGGQLNEQDSIGVIRRALESGINFFDTADIYTGGQSERITGKGLKGCRDEVVIASKVGGPSEESLNGRGLSRKHILSAVEKSLKRLDTDYLDVYYMHFPHPSTPLEESLEAMNALVQSGKVRYIGMSNYAAWQMMDALGICDKRNRTAPAITQSVCNLLTRGIETELVPFIKEKRIGLAVYNPLAGGLLSGKHGREHPVENTRLAEPGYHQRYWNEDSLTAMDGLKEIARTSGMDLLELSLRWCVSYAYVSSVIIGVSCPEHLIRNLSCLEKGALSPDALARCDDVWRMLQGNRFAYNR
jgi:aryl-alcohol dehydrogenase (NADP+)